MEAKQKIRAQVQDILNVRGDSQPFGDQDSLIFSGRIDSLNVLEIGTPPRCSTTYTESIAALV